MRRTVPDIPDWFKKLPGDAMLNSTEVAKILGYKNTNTHWDAMWRGNAPEPDTKVRKRTGCRFGKHDTNMWKVSTIRKFLKQKEEQHGKTQEAHTRLVGETPT